MRRQSDYSYDAPQKMIHKLVVDPISSLTQVEKTMVEPRSRDEYMIR